MDHIEKPCGKNDARKKASSSSSAKEYVCDICSKRFSRKAYLIEHQVGSLTRFLKRLMRVMTNPHFIDCLFYLYGMLKVPHLWAYPKMRPQARHRGTKDRECPICHKWFYSSSYWRHMTLVHPKKDKLVHQCEICHRTFPQVWLRAQFFCFPNMYTESSILRKKRSLHFFPLYWSFPLKRDLPAKSKLKR